MKQLYRIITRMTLSFLVIFIPMITNAQESVIPSEKRTNLAPCYNYWSVGAFGGLMQFNGDLSRELWLNLYPQSVGYTTGIVLTRQFSRVIGFRASIAYDQINSNVADKWVWDYQEGKGTPQKITQRFGVTVIETDLQLTINWLNWIRDYKPGRIFSSYLIGGVGIDHAFGTKWDVDGKEIAFLGKPGEVTNVGNTRGIKESNMQLKAIAGLGFDFNLSRHFSVPIEIAWRWQNSDLLDMTHGGTSEIENDMYSSASVGLTYKFGYSCPKTPEVTPLPLLLPVVPVTPATRFSVYAPVNIPVERKLREIFPVRNYIFFNIGSTEIPDRYVLLTKYQVSGFKEDQLDLFQPKNLSGRSERQLIVYYNVLNILGDRMGKLPTSTITLVGSSEKDPADGKVMAESVKRYLTSVFDIDPARITTTGRDKPKIPSERPWSTHDLDLLMEGDRRVSIESSSPELLMEFAGGTSGPMKPVEIFAVQKAPIESYISVQLQGAKDAFNSWSLEIKDSDGVVRNFGPYNREMVTLSGKMILGNRQEGSYTVVMVGKAKNGTIVRKDTTIHMAIWPPPDNQEVTRFSIIYEFDESRAIMIYEKYLTDIVIPKIPEGGTVIIQGYTDIIGDENHNEVLSLARANDVRNILARELTKVSKKDVRFVVYGFGEDPDLSPFENKYPEERFYNRTVIIDIIPKN